jgi:hemerythrin superfamily protein
MTQNHTPDMTQDRIDAIELLVTQHRSLESLLGRFFETKDEAARQALFAKAADELTVHIESEERVFYPAVKAARTEDILLESLEEHLSLKRLLADLLELGPGDLTFEPKFKVLKEQTEHHHKEEEENLFPKAQKLIDAAQREELGRQMLDLQQEMKRRGEPRDTVAGETREAAPLR